MPSSFHLPKLPVTPQDPEVPAGNSARRPRSNFRDVCPSLGFNDYDIARDGMVFVRNTNPVHDISALDAVEPEMLRLGLLPTGLLVEALHGEIFDAAKKCDDPFSELHSSHLTGAGASDACLLATLLYYRDAIFALGAGVCLWPLDHEAELFAVVRAICASEGEPFPLGARRLSVLAQHTMFALAEQARRDSAGTQPFIRSLRRLIAQGRLCAMLDPRSALA